MATGSAARTPFDAGASSVKERLDAPNPFAAGTVESRNFELGRTFAMRQRRVTAYPSQRPA